LAHCKKKQSWNYGDSSKWKILLEDEVPPLWAHLYRWEGEDFKGKTYGMGLMWGDIGNTLEEHIGNLGKILGTHWELERNMLGTKEKFKKISPTPKLKRKKKNQGTLSACQALPLATWDFYFQNCSSPFLAWANTPNPHYKLGVLVLIEGANPTSMFRPNVCHEFIPIGGINIPTFVWVGCLKQSASTKLQHFSFLSACHSICGSDTGFDYLSFFVHSPSIAWHFWVGNKYYKTSGSPKASYSQGEPALTSVPFTLHFVWVNVLILQNFVNKQTVDPEKNYKGKRKMEKLMV